MWNEREIRVSIRHVPKFFIYVGVTTSRGKCWEMAAVYTSLNTSQRRVLWDKLNEIHVDDARALTGDFNCVLRPNEKEFKKWHFSSFVKWVDRRGLIDTGFADPPFTWNHGTDVLTRRSARLDRLCVMRDGEDLFNL